MSLSSDQILTILALAEGIKPQKGKTRTYCPFCKVVHERSFAMTHTGGGIWYKCYRASCGVSGMVDIENKMSFETSPDKIEKDYIPKYYPHETGLINWNWDGHLKFTYKLKNYSITKEDTLENKFYVSSKDTLVIPIYNPQQVWLGMHDRDYFNNRSPKALHYWCCPPLDLRGYFPLRFEYKEKVPLIIVEDIISCIVMNRYSNCMALLGSALTKNNAMHLRVLWDELVFMLDPKAEANALGMARTYRSMFKTKVILPPKDPKELTHKEIVQLLNESGVNYA